VVRCRAGVARGLDGALVLFLPLLQVMVAKDPKHRLGRWAEQLARGFFENCGFCCLAERYRKPGGEIDLVMRRGSLVVFVEVKARSRVEYGRPEEAVGQRKLTRLRLVARHFLHERQLGAVDLRFDVVAVESGGEGRGYRLRHFPDVR